MRNLSLSLLLLGTYATTIAQSFINYTVATTSKALCYNNIRSIVKDSQGNKWITTEDGISVFNGTDWTTFTHDNGLTENFVYSVAIDAQNNKWFGTDYGVSKFDGSKWTTYLMKDGLINNLVRTIAVDLKGNIWFGTDKGVSKYDGFKWTSYTTANGLPTNSIMSIAVDSMGYIWIGTYGGGVAMFNDTSWVTYNTSNGLASNIILKIRIDKYNNKWFGTESGVTVYDDKIWKTFSTADGLLNNRVWDIFIVSENNVWFATEGGVSELNNSKWISYTTVNGLTSNYVKAIVIDNDGTKWFGTGDKGLSKFDGNVWKTYTIEGGLSNNKVLSVALDSASNIWAGTLGSGVCKFDGKNWTYYTTDNGLAFNEVNAIAIDSNNIIWFGTRNGLSKFDGKNWVTYTTSDGLVSNYINYIYFDKYGTKWIATNSGVSNFNDTTWINYTTENGLANNFVYTITSDSLGNMWFGLYYDGVSKFDGKSWTNYTTSNGLAYSLVPGIAIDNQDVKWFGTLGGGVSKFDNKSWTTYNEKSGLTSKYVTSVLIDKQGLKWFGTDRAGFSIFDGTNWNNYWETHGLAGNDVYTIVMDKDGNKWFGTDGGISKFIDKGFNVPGVQASNVHVSLVTTDEMNINWTNGNGSKRAVFFKQDSIGFATPVTNTSYTANSVFGTPATQLGTSGWYCVYNGTDSNVNVTGLSTNTIYRVMVCDYNGYSGMEKYNTSIESKNPINLSTSALFTEQTDIVLHGIKSGTAAWADYDNNGFIDLLLTGFSQSGQNNIPITKIYKNNGNNSFSEQNNIVLPSLGNSSAAWGDFNNDNYQDIMLTGFDGTNNISKLFKNNGNNTFSELNIPFTGVSLSSVAWGDYNNDGHLDILLSGYNGSKAITELYKNNGDNTFSLQSNINIIGVYYSSLAWGDYDNDNYLDILITGGTGSSGYNCISKIYHNNGNNTFTELTGLNLPGVKSGSATWQDYDNDGYLDFLITGNVGTGSISKIYHNNGNSTFSEQKLYYIEISSESAVAWSDYNNDGNSDFMLTGNVGAGSYITLLYRNNGDSAYVTSRFTEEKGASFYRVNDGSVAWADYDNDDKLDLIVTGSCFTASEPVISKIYHNNGSFKNNKPGVASNLNAQISESTNEVTLTWDKAIDQETPQNSLLYNIFVYNAVCLTDSGIQTLTPSNNKCIAAKFENVRWNNSGLKLTGLPKDEKSYKWTVQTIDGVHSKSDFAPGNTFTMTGGNVTSPTVQTFNILFSNINQTDVTISWTNGNGSKRNVFMKQSNTGTAAPVNNITYTANSVFGTPATQLGNSGWYCVYNGTGSNVKITGLSANTTYRVMICEYNGNAGSELYNTSTATNNPVNQTTSGTSTKQNQTISFTSLPYSVYGDNDIDPKATASSSLQVVYSSSDTTLAKIINNKIKIIGVGTCNIFADQPGDGSYYPAPQVSKTLTINKKTLTVRADNKKRNYGYVNPQLTITYTGFAYNDDTSDIIQPEIYTTATQLSLPGIYPITLNGGSAVNYEIKTVDGLLTVNKATLFILADNKEKFCGQSNPVFSLSYFGFINDDDENNLITKPSAFTKADIMSPVGLYDIYLTEGLAENYTLNYVKGKLTVKPLGPSNKYLSLCNGQSYTLHNGSKVNKTGIYSDTLIAWNGCDSIEIVYINIVLPSTKNKTVNICKGKTYFAEGKYQSDAGTYHDTIRTYNGCDSLYITTQIVIDEPALVDAGNDTSICMGDTITLIAKGNGGKITWEGYYGSKITITPELTSTYTAVASNSCNSAYDFIIVDVAEKPGIPEVYQFNESLITDANANIQWYEQSTGMIDNATDWIYAPNASGNYYVIASNGTCNSEPSNKVPFTYVNTNNITEISDDAIRLFPNPVNDNLFIDSKKVISKIEIFNIIGKSDLEINVGRKDRYSFKTNSLLPGVYIIKIFFDNNKQPVVKAFVKE